MGSSRLTVTGSRETVGMRFSRRLEASHLLGLPASSWREKNREFKDRQNGEGESLGNKETKPAGGGNVLLQDQGCGDGRL